MGSKISCHAVALKRALAFAAQPVERRNTIPALGMVLIRGDAAQGRVTVTGTDLDVECKASIEAQGGDFSALLPPRLLAGLLRWGEGDVTISRDADIVTIRVDDVVATIREVCPVADWPAMAMGDALAQPIRIGEAKLRTALRSVVPCISTEETRYYLNGVYLHRASGGLVMAATDGHRMGIYRTGEAWPFPDVILPRKAATLLLRSLPLKSNGAVSVTGFGPKAPTIPEGASEHQKGIMAWGSSVPRLEFCGDGWSIRSKTIDGTFPDYTRVLPSHHDDISVTISAAAIRRFPSTGERTRAVKIEGDAGRMTWRDPDGVEVSMPVTGRGAEFGVNLNLLKPFADLAGEIRIEGQNAREPLRILTADPALVQVLMPMRV